MPIKVPDLSPANIQLKDEGVMVMTSSDALRQDIRPLQIGLLNLMPNKLQTEVQFARLLGATPLQVELTFVSLETYKPKNTNAEYLADFYKPWSMVSEQRFDGFIITGAPVETMEFSDVAYWSELERIFNWTATNVYSSVFVCWGAMAAFKHFHDIEKQALSQKAFGVFNHQNLNPLSEYLKGFSDEVFVPVSRWTTLERSDVENVAEVLLDHSEVGPCLTYEEEGRRLYMLNHLEYDSNSLAEEYFRDVKSGVGINIPLNYFDQDDPENQPVNRWRSLGQLFYRNWINSVYQNTPYDLNEIDLRDSNNVDSAI